MANAARFLSSCVIAPSCTLLKLTTICSFEGNATLKILGLSATGFAALKIASLRTTLNSFFMRVKPVAFCTDNLYSAATFASDSPPNNFVLISLAISAACCCAFWVCSALTTTDFTCSKGLFSAALCSRTRNTTKCSASNSIGVLFVPLITSSLNATLRIFSSAATPSPAVLVNNPVFFTVKLNCSAATLILSEF